MRDDIDEEAIYSALFDRMSTVLWTRTGESTPNSHRFKTMSRQVKIFSDVPTGQQPACYQAEWATDEQQITAMPYKTALAANWIVYQAVNNNKNPNWVGAQENNMIIGGIRKALRPLPSDPGYLDDRNTLNGLVYHCYISGRIFKDPGDIDNQGMMVVPIKLLVP